MKYPTFLVNLAAKTPEMIQRRVESTNPGDMLLFYGDFPLGGVEERVVVYGELRHKDLEASTITVAPIHVLLVTGTNQGEIVTDTKTQKGRFQEEISGTIEVEVEKIINYACFSASLPDLYRQMLISGNLG